MQVDDKLLSRLEKLSYLKVADEKRAEIVEQLSEIVSFVDNLSELDTAGIDATFAMNNNSTPLREDIPSCETTINDEILRHAPNASEHFFIVPKIIE